jgi:DNA polymerase-3 subunit beta
MKVVCHREGLLSACQLVSVAAAARDINPVLRNLKAVVEPDRCTLMATDTEVGIRMEVLSVTVEEPGEALWPAGRVLSILREATDDELTIEANADSCVLRGRHMEYEMPGEDPAVFPDFPTFAEDKYHEIPAGVLREMIRRTAFAVASAENTKFGATTGILWELHGNKAKLVATDGRRLALCEGSARAQGSHTTEGQMPVAPAKAMSLLERNLQDEEEPVRVSLRPNEILIRTERATIYSRLVEGRFPDYRRVLPQKQNIKIPLQVGPFQTAIRQAAIMTDEETKRVVFTFDKRKLTLQARGVGAGSSKVEMELDYSGSPIEISFDPKFLLEMLRVLEPEAQLSLELVDSKSPALFRLKPHTLSGDGAPADSGDATNGDAPQKPRPAKKETTGDYLYVVVPMVVKDQA